MTNNSEKPVVLVTGASGGIGQATAQWFFDKGYQLVVTSRSLARLNEKFSSIPSEDILLIESGLSNASDIKNVIFQIQKQFSRLSAVVHCAGNMHQSPLAMVRETDIGQQYQVHLTTSVLLAQFASRIMARQKQGAICYVSSVVADQGAHGQVVYASAKAGLKGVVKSLAKELGGNQIRVNAVSPGFIETDLVSGFDQEQREHIKARTCLKKLGSPIQVAEVIGFLCSDNASYITGQTINVDAGLVL